MAETVHGQESPDVNVLRVRTYILIPVPSSSNQWSETIKYSGLGLWDPAPPIVLEHAGLPCKVLHLQWWLVQLTSL